MGIAQYTDYSSGYEPGAILVGLLITELICGAIGGNVWHRKGGSRAQGFAIGLLLGIFGLLIVFLATPRNMLPAGAVPPPPSGWKPTPDEVVATLGPIHTGKKREVIPAGEKGRIVEVRDDDARVRFSFGSYWLSFEDLSPTGRSVAATPTPDVDSELRKLGKLRDDGLLTEEEFQRQKAKLLA